MSHLRLVPPPIENEMPPQGFANQIQPGVYLRADGGRAIVARYRQCGMVWLLDGVFEDRKQGFLGMTSWNLNGQHKHSGLNLISRVENQK